MRSIVLPYTLYKGRRAPIIPIQLQGPRGWVPIWAYVDSGASFSILSAQSFDVTFSDIRKRIIFTPVRKSASFR